MALMMNPRDARPEADILAELRNLTSNAGYIHVLAFLSWRDNYIGFGSEFTPDDMAKSYVAERLLRSEFVTLQGLMLQSKIQLKLPDPSSLEKLVNETTRLMAELHASFNKPMMDIFKQQKDPQKESPFSRAQILREPIFYGGESAHDFQYSALASRRYASDNDWLVENAGFSARNMEELVKCITNILETKLFIQIKAISKANPGGWEVLPAFVFSKHELSKLSGIDIQVVERFLEKFSTKSFSNQSFKEIGDFNLVSARPIIEIEDGKYVCFETYTLSEAIYDSPYYWMQSDQIYRDKASANRGKFTEEFTKDRLEKVFGSSNVFQNVNIEGKKGNIAGEVDILVKFGRRALVVQCKSKKLTLDARKGNDGQLKSDFQKSVQDSYDQSVSCISLLKANKFKAIAEGGAQIDLSAVTEFYPICVTSESYPALTVQAREILKIKTGVKGLYPPFVTDVFMIDVVTEFLESPLYMLSYIDRRVNYNDLISSINEFAILGYHLKKNLWFDDDTNLVMFDESLSIDLDTAFSVRRRNIPGSDTPEGILTKIRKSYLGRIIQSIENSENSALIALGFSLLTLSEETVETIEEGVNKIQLAHQQDLKHHDFSISFGDGHEGLTIHCNELPPFIAMPKLEEHCTLRKYVNKAQKWFGMNINASNGMPNFGVTMEGAWARDEQLERATAGMNTKGNVVRVGRQLKNSKIGRNSQCPCGSGRKHKKCCLYN